jgi:fructose-bisphosphate aldolase, class II
MIVSSIKLFKLAYNHYAIGAYSVNSLEQIIGIFEGAIEAQAPVIVQVSGKAHEYVGLGVLESAIHAVAANYPQVVFGIHLDHGNEAEAHACIDSGQYSSVMVDASMYPFEENIVIARRVAEHGRLKGVTVEAELGRLGGKEEDSAVDESEAFLTDPGMAAEFVRRSGVDSLAVAVGTSHGIRKFKGQQSLHLERLTQIQQAMPGVPLVLHGASSVSPEEVRRINAAGGQVDPQANGVPEAQYADACQRGVCKINVDTDSRLIWARVNREYFRDHPHNIDLRGPGKILIKEVGHMIAHHSRLFGCAGRQEEVLAVKT